MMRRIEMLGLAGSGKSTLVKRFIQVRHSRGSPSVSLDDALYLSLRRLAGRGCPPALAPRRQSNPFVRIARKAYVKRHLTPDLLFVGLGEFIAENAALVDAAIRGIAPCDLPERALVLRLVLSFWSRYRIVEKHLNSSYEVWLDEGFAQRAVSLFGRLNPNDENHALARYLQDMPLPAFLIVLDADPALCRQRIQARKKGMPKRLRAFTAEQQKAAQSEFASCIESVVAQMRARGVHVVRADSAKPVEAVIEEVESRLDGRG